MTRPPLGERWVVLITAAVFALVMAGRYVSVTLPRLGNDSSSDFVKYYVLSWRLRHDQPVYAPLAVQGELRSRLGWSANRGKIRPADPPALVLLTWPFSLVSYATSWWLLALASSVGVFACAFGMARLLETPVRSSLVFGLLALTSYPTWVLLVLNHIEAVVLIAGVLGWYCLRTKRDALAGIFWGLAAAWKLFPMLWVVALARYPADGKTPRGAAFASGVATVLVATALACSVIGLDQISVFVTEVIPQSSEFRTSPVNHALLSFGTRVHSAALGWALVVAMGMCVLRGLLARPGSADRVWVLSITASLLLAPLAWSYYLILIPPCLIVLAAHREGTSAAEQAVIYALGFTLMFYPSLLGSWNPMAGMAAAVPNLALAIDSVPTFALLFLYFYAERKIE